MFLKYSTFKFLNSKIAIGGGALEWNAPLNGTLCDHSSKTFFFSKNHSDLIKNLSGDQKVMFEQSNEQNNTNIPAQLQLLQHFICNNQL